MITDIVGDCRLFWNLIMISVMVLFKTESGDGGREDGDDLMTIVVMMLLMMMMMVMMIKHDVG